MTDVNLTGLSLRDWPLVGDAIRAIEAAGGRIVQTQVEFRPYQYAGNGPMEPVVELHLVLALPEPEPEPAPVVPAIPYYQQRDAADYRDRRYRSRPPRFNRI